MKKNRPLPKLDFNITNRCNFRCRHCCFSSGETQMRELSFEKIKNILDEFSVLGGERIDITGGEPTLRKDYSEIIFYAKKIGLKVELVTNGSLLGKAQFEELQKIGLNAIAISLDGSNYNIYQKTRPISREIYEKIMENIRLSINYDFYTKINTVVRCSNFFDLIRLSDLAINLGAQEHGFYYFTPVGRGWGDNNEVVPPLTWLNFIRTKLAVRQEKIRLSLETPLMEKNCQAETSCYLEHPWHLQLLPDGNVYPCAIMAAYGHSCGNLYEKTLTEIWQDEKLWDGTYYKKNVAPYLKEFGSCINFGRKFKDIKSNRYKFVCLMCKFKKEEFKNEKRRMLGGI